MLGLVWILIMIPVKIVQKSSPLLFAGGFAGFTVWIICSSLYYMCEPLLTSNVVQTVKASRQVQDFPKQYSQVYVLFIS